eukprot:350164-Chlamydomonas_euryale.AAC.5
MRQRSRKFTQAVPVTENVTPPHTHQHTGLLPTRCCPTPGPSSRGKHSFRPHTPGHVPTPLPIPVRASGLVGARATSPCTDARRERALPASCVEAGTAAAATATAPPIDASLRPRTWRGRRACSAAGPAWPAGRLEAPR